MDYLVCAEDTTYYHWQLELLIQSFQINNQENNLVIALASEAGATYLDFRKLLPKHKRLIGYDNIGKQKGYRYLNRPYGVIAALTHEYIKQPFCLIEPDMVMYKPLPEVTTENVICQMRPAFSLEYIESCNLPIHQYLRESNGDKTWLPIGDVHVFNNMPLGWFYSVAERCEQLLLECQQEPWKHLERVGWAFSLMEHFDHIFLRSVYNLEMTLVDHQVDHHFINYAQGLPPFWNKLFYRYEEPDYFGGGPDPYEILTQYNPTTSMNYMQKVIHAYRNS